MRRKLKVSGRGKYNLRLSFQHPGCKGTCDQLPSNLQTLTETVSFVLFPFQCAFKFFVKVVAQSSVCPSISHLVCYIRPPSPSFIPSFVCLPALYSFSPYSVGLFVGLSVWSVLPSFPAYAIDDQSIGFQIAYAALPFFFPSSMHADQMIHPSSQPFVRPSIPRGRGILKKFLYGEALPRGPNPSPWKVPRSQ